MRRQPCNPRPLAGACGKLEDAAGHPYQAQQVGAARRGGFEALSTPDLSAPARSQAALTRGEGAAKSLRKSADSCGPQGSQPAWAQGARTEPVGAVAAPRREDAGGIITLASCSSCLPSPMAPPVE